jgi:hypothetical protein
MSSEEDLRERIYDSIASGRNTLRVVKVTKAPVIEGGATFLCSFLVSLDGATHDALCAAATKRERSVTSLLRRLAILCFRDCLADDEAEEEQKAGGAGASAIDSPRA